MGNQNIQTDLFQQDRQSPDAAPGEHVGGVNGSLGESSPDPSETKKRLLFLHRAPYFAGAEKRFLDWLGGIDYSKHCVFLAHTEDVFSVRIRALGLPVVCAPLEFQALAGFWKVFFSSLLYFRRMRPDQIVMIDSYFLEWPLAVVLAAYLAARGNVYMTEHTPTPEPSPRSSRVHFGLLPGLGLGRHFFLWQLRFRAHVSRRVIAVSENLKQWMVQKYSYPEAKVVVAYHGVDTHLFRRPTPTNRGRLRASLGIPESGTVIVSTARLHHEKRVDRLMDAFAAIALTHPNLWLVLAGDGPEKDRLLQMAASAGVFGRTRFMGWLEDVSPVLKASDIYVLSSDFEGFGVALLEAMASELICVATNTFGPREVIADGKNGFLVEPSEVGVREGLVRALALSQAQREMMARNARQTIVFKFSIREGIRRGLAALNIVACDSLTDGS